MENFEIMFSFIGEQPIPNLLPVKYFKPSKVVMIYTELTEEVKDRLKNVLSKQRFLIDDSCKTDPYKMDEIISILERLLIKYTNKKIIFNLTGGTKPMTFAGYKIAEKYRIPFVYLRSEKNKTVFMHYEFKNNSPILEEISVPPLISLKEHIEAHISNYQITNKTKDDPGGKFEKAVKDALIGEVDEVIIGVRLNNIQVDLLIRCGNHVGVAELKKSGYKTSAVNQIVLPARREYLGTYVKKFVIVGDKATNNLKGRAKPAGVKVIELPSFKQSNDLSKDDKMRLIQEIRKSLT